MKKINLGFACICKSLGDKGKFKTMTVKRASQLSDTDRYEQLQQRTRQNFSNLYDIIKWLSENDLHLYRVSSGMCPLYTHEICNYDFIKDQTVLDLCSKIAKMCKENNIRLTIHPDQFTLLNSEKESVNNNAIINLEYHYKLCSLLGITDICLHVGGKAGGVDEGKYRFMQTWERVPMHLKKLIRLENCDKSYNVEETLELCETLDIPMIVDFHHDAVLKSTDNIREYLGRIIGTWKDVKPLCHISSSADDVKTVSKHHDYIKPADWLAFRDLTQGIFDIEVEAKQKDLAVLRLINKF